MADDKEGDVMKSLGDIIFGTIDEISGGNICLYCSESIPAGQCFCDNGRCEGLYKGLAMQSHPEGLDEDLKEGYLAKAEEGIKICKDFENANLDGLDED